VKKRLFIIACALVVIGAAAAAALNHACPVQMATYAGLTRNYFILVIALAGTITTELNATYRGAGNVAPLPAAEALSPSARDWREPRRV
jgi:hypothetical protein